MKKNPYSVLAFMFVLSTGSVIVPPARAESQTALVKPVTTPTTQRVRDFGTC